MQAYYPSLYSNPWSCLMCNAAKETFNHLWICPNQLPTMTTIIFESKDKLLFLLRVQQPNLPYNNPHFSQIITDSHI